MIREMIYKDIRETAAIENELFGVPWTEKILEENLDNKLYSVYIAQRDEEIAGYICFMTVAGESELLRIAVSTGCQRQGIAAQLMDFMLEKLKAEGVRDITLEVRSRNKAAISLYEKYGFKVEGVRKRYYRKPEDDALIMWKRSIV